MSLTHGRQGQPAASDQAHRRQASNSSAARIRSQPQIQSRSGTQAQSPQQYASAAAQEGFGIRIHGDLPRITFLDRNVEGVNLSQAMRTAIPLLADQMMTDIGRVARSGPRMDKLRKVTNGTMSFTDAFGLKSKKDICLMGVMARRGCSNPKDGLFTCKQCFNGRWFCIRVMDNQLVAVQLPQGARQDSGGVENEDGQMLDSDDGHPLLDWVRSPSRKKSQSYPEVWP
jgi:hypothetical protein